MSDYISREAMSETPKCPYCGDRMALHVLPHTTEQEFFSAWYQCVTCESTSPRVEFIGNTSQTKIEERLQAVSSRRAEPKNRVLTLEELKAYCTEGADAAPLWYEDKDNGDVSRWMVIDLPELAFGSTATVKRLMNSQFFEPAYGKNWRCWLRKPTNEEMEGTPWEENRA